MISLCSKNKILGTCQAIEELKNLRGGIMFLFITIILLIIFIILKFKLHLKVKWKTMLKKGFRPSRKDFGLYTYTGNQGKGKTYSLIEYIFDNAENSFFFVNIKDIKCVRYYGIVDNYNCVYFNGFTGLVNQKQLLDSGFYNNVIGNKQIVFVFDELFTELQKKSTLSLEIQDFLCQLRKRRIIFLTTAQVWSEIPLYFRRLCRYQIDCNMFPLFNTGFLIKKFNDAENMRWDNDLQEHVAPTLELSFSKVRKIISNSYNTEERITKN